jgi:hypothetical protein
MKECEVSHGERVVGQYVSPSSVFISPNGNGTDRSRDTPRIGRKLKTNRQKLHSTPTTSLFFSMHAWLRAPCVRGECQET